MLFRAQVSKDFFVGLVMRRETVRPNENNGVLGRKLALSCRCM